MEMNEIEKRIKHEVEQDHNRRVLWPLRTRNKHQHLELLMKIVDDMKREFFEVIDKDEYETVVFPKLVRIIIKWIGESEAHKKHREEYGFSLNDL